MDIKIGDIVQFKRMYKIGIDDLIYRKSFTKYMLVINAISVKSPHKKSDPKKALQVMCANGETNWVSVDRIEKVTKA